MARNCPSNPSNPSNASTLANGSAILLESRRFRRSKTSHLLDCGLWALCETVGGVAQTVGSGLWRAKSFFSSGPKLPFKPLKPLKPLKRFDTCQWFCHTSGFWTLQTLHGRLRRSKTSHLLDCGLWALCETVGGVAQPVGSGLWRAKSYFSSGPKLPFKPLKPLKRFDTCQWFCHTSGFWTLQTLHGRFRRSKTSHLLDCGLWALCETVGGVAQTVGSGLWRAKSFFLVAQNCPSNPSNPSKRFDPCQWFCHTSGFWTLQTLHGRFRRSKTSHLLDCGLWALCETVGGVAQTVGSGLWRAKSFFSSGPTLPFKPLKPLKPLKRFDTCQWFCHTSGFWTLQTLHGRFRRSKTSHLLDCGLWALCETVGGVAQTVGSGLQNLALARLWALGSVRDCGWLRRLWARGSGAPNPFFLVARNFLPYFWILDASDAPKPRTC